MAKARTQKETVAILQKTYPKFNKVAASMVAHPERYGVCLTREAKKALGDAKPKQPNRKKNHQLTLRLDDDKYAILMSYCEREKRTPQKALEMLINLLNPR